MNKKKRQKQDYYWFILDNYIHTAVQGNSVLFYNPLTGKILEYDGGGSNGLILKLVKRLHSTGNLLVIGLSKKELLNPGMARFIQDMREAFMGDLIDASLTQGKPIQLKPYVKVQKDVVRIKKDEYRSVGENMMKYLAEISLYVNSTCALDCNICGSAYKQFLCCTRSKQGKEELDILSIKNLFEQMQGAPLVRVNILGGNIREFSKLADLAAVLKEHLHSCEKVIYCHYLNLFQPEKKYNLFPADSFSFKILVTFPVKQDRWQQALEKIREHNINLEFHFIISSEEEVNEAEELISSSSLEHYSLSPFFNGRNRSFFEKNVFFDKEDIREARPTFKEIMSRQLVNPLHFGTLTVLSSGHIHANVNESPLGILDKDNIYDVVYKEMSRGKSWMRIRKKMEPCKHCTFAALCPPLSNYEYALNRNNLCHIR